MADPDRLLSEAPLPDDVHGALEDPLVEAFGMLVEAHNELTSAVTRRLEVESSIPVPWLGVLIRLARTPDQRLRMSQIAREMTMSTSGLTRLVDRIEAAGHVARQACPEDRRGMWAVLTDEGRRVVSAAIGPHVCDLGTHLGAALDDRELAELTDLLRRVRDHVRDADHA